MAVVTVPDPRAVREQVSRMVSSSAFAGADRSAAFLRYVVEQTLSGAGDSLKEYTIALAVFGRPDTFDPRSDSVVRVEARKLRSKVATYYEADGISDAVIIEIPRGTYVPVFTDRTPPPSPQPERPSFNRRWFMGAGFAATACVLAVPFIWTSRRRDDISVAVLPFRDLSEEGNYEFFADGLTDDLIDALTKLPDLKVVARTSAFRFRDPQADSASVAEALGVGHLVTGSVRRIGSRIRIAAQIADIRDHSITWSQTFDRELADVLDVQREISAAIADSFHIRVADTRRLAGYEKTNPKTYDLYLQARRLAARRTGEALREAVGQYEQAVAMDPQFVPALVGEATAQVLLANYGFAPPRDTMPKAKSLAERAVKLDGGFAEAYNVLGAVHAGYEWDWKAADHAFRRAIELAPSLADAHHWYAFFCLSPTGRHQASFASMARAKVLDPLSAVIAAAQAEVYNFGRQYDEAIRVGQAAVRLAPNYYPSYVYLGMAYERKKMFDEAKRSREKAAELAGDSPLALRVLGQTYASMGNRQGAEQVIAKLRQRSTSTYVPAAAIGPIYACLGDKDAAFEWLQKAIDERSAWMIYLNVNGVFDSLRGDGRFNDLVRRIGV